MKKFPLTKWFLPLVILLVIKALMMSMFISGIIGGNAAEAVGIDENRVDVSGRNVTMTGFATEAEANAAETLVEEEVAWTSNVNAIVDGAPTPAEAVTAGNVNIAAGVEDVVLTGVVASDATRTAVVEAAQQEFEPDQTVVDQLEVDPAVSVDGAVVVIDGEAADEDQRSEWAASAGVIAEANNFRLTDNLTVVEPAQPQVQPVDELNNLFELEPIEFDIARATIRPASQATLDAAGAIVTENPDAGTFMVVGHTDSDGDDSANQALSDLRAQAVVDYLVQTAGVDAERLESEGRGESELKVSPEITPEDKQRNRRIEWELV